jgi:predicted 3-demethylubiquinone-9 3-methyltransferase (glyoxalase superfamily)
MSTTRQKITPCLWFNFNAEEAVAHYLGIFKRARILEISRYGDAMREFKGKVLVIRFELEGQEIQALNGGPQYPFTEAISLSVDCADQAEVDEMWARLAEGGSPGRCGWLKDKFGLSWQIVPRALATLLTDPDPGRASRVMQSMLTMSKIDINRLQQVHDNP